MDTHTLANTDIVAGSRLLIHAAGDVRADAWTFESLIQRLRSRDSGGLRKERPLLQLEIQDLHGHRVLALDDTGAQVDIALSPGTYQITAQQGSIRRAYTVTLEPGVSFDLHLRLAPTCH